MKLIKFSNGRWGMTSDNVWSVGSLEKVRETMELDMAVKPTEVELALESMTKKDHNIAEFGMEGSFIFSELQSMSAG